MSDAHRSDANRLQNQNQVVGRALLEGSTTVFRAVQEEDNSLVNSWKGFFDLHLHVVKTCPFCNSTKPRPDRSHVSGLRAEELGDLIFLDHGLKKKNGDKTVGVLFVLNGGTSYLTADPCKST